MAFVHFRETPPETPLIVSTLLAPEGTNFSFDTSFAPAISPDGKKIAFVARGKGGSLLYVRALSATAATPFAGTEGATHPFWSPDSRWVGYGTESKLSKVDVTGGPPIVLTSLTAQFRAARGIRKA